MAFTNSAAFKKGRIGEDLVRGLMDWAGVETNLNESNKHSVLKTCDIRCKLYGIPFSIESKLDAMESETGNLAIEFHNPRTNKPSGIMATESDLWAIVLQDPTSIWICRTDSLKKYFAKQKPVKEIKRGGDGNASLSLFKSKALLEAICTRIDNLTPWDIMDVIINLLGPKFRMACNSNLENSTRKIFPSASTAI